MKVIRSSDTDFIPASHEDKKDPQVFKKVLFQARDFVSGGKVQMINWARLLKNKRFKAHYHQDMDEVFIILSGRARIRIENEEKILGKGDAVFIPAKKIHQMESISKTDVDYIVVGLSRGKGGKTIMI